MLHALFLALVLGLCICNEIPIESRAQIIEKPQIITKDEGDNVTLPCTVRDSSSSDIIVWNRGSDINLYFVGPTTLHREGPRVLRGNDETNPVLTISDLKVGDSDIYSCQMGPSKTDNSVSHTLVVRQPPSIISYSPADEVITIGQSQQVTLSCNAQGKPDPSMIWYHKPLAAGAERQIAGHEAQLVFSNPNPRKDSGTYICEAKNEVGKAEHPFELNIEYKPEIEVDNPVMHAGKNADTVITCRVYGNPRPTVVWTRERDMKKLTVSEGDFIVKYTKNDATLIIRTTSEKDFDNYTCIAENNLGHAMARIEIVGTPSHPRIRSHTNQYSIEPRYTVEWEVLSNYGVTGYRLRYRKARFNETINDPGEWTVVEIPAYDNDLSPMEVKQEKNEFIHTRRLAIEEIELETNYELEVEAENEFGLSKPSDTFKFAVYLPSHQGFSGAQSMPCFQFLPSVLSTILAILYIFKLK